MTYPNGNATVPESGERLVDGAYLNGNGLAGGHNRSAMTLKALVGGAAPGTNISLINAAIVEVSTVASAGDSVQLPSAQGNDVLDVVNSTVNSMNVYSNAKTPTDTINGTPGTAPLAVAGGQRVRFFSTQKGKWFANLSA